MPNNWKKYKLDDIAEILNSKRIPLNSRDRSHRQGTYPYYGASGIVDYVNDFIFEGEHVLISEDGENLRSRNTPIAFLANGKFWVNNHAHIVKGKYTWANRFIVYYFQNTDVTPYLTGAVQPKLNKESLLNIPINVDLSAVEGMVEILSALDDKIELNLQTNKTLEEMANTLYKHWFVDFGPFKNGKFIKSELGMIPDGWHARKIGSEIDFTNGFAFKGSDFIDTGVPVLKIKNVKAGKILLDNLAYVSKEVLLKAHKSKINSNDILLTMTGNRLDGSPETWVGKSALFMRDGEYYLNQRVSKLKVKSTSDLSNFYLSLHLSSEEMQNYFISNSTSSGGQANISPDLVYDIMVPFPKKKISCEFDEIIVPIFEQIHSHDIEVDILKQTRDYLLPKLITGEISIKNAEKKVKELI